MPTTMLALAALKISVPGMQPAEQRRDEGQREVAVDHGRDARQDLQDGLTMLRTRWLAYSLR